MPYQVDIEKEYQGEYWTNRYLVNSATLQAAVDAGTVLLGIERSYTPNSINFTKVRASDGVKNSDVYQTTPVNLVGMLTPQGNLLPLFNVIRVDMAAGAGRPSRKYYRGMLTTVAVGASFAISGDALTNAVALANALEASGVLIDPQGTPIGDCTVASKIGMRQLRRGSRQKTEEIIPA